MSSNVAKISQSLPALAMSENELMDVLRSSLYVGAKDSSIKMAVNYCKAAGLDIMQKPVHLVPIWDGKAKEMRDVVMPGIGLYRTQASRSEQMAGITEPVFGDDVTEKLGGVEVTYPKDCRVTVKRLLANGATAEYVAVERWKENYAVKGGQEKSIAPNSMWLKRPYGQLAKCAEAQALRKAFPELGSMPTAEEMEGKEIDITPTNSPSQPTETPTLDDAAFNVIANKYKESVVAGKKSVENFVSWVESKGALMTQSQKEQVKSWVKKEPTVVEGEATTVQDDFAAAYEAAESENQ